jgi:hypothetical protein
VEAVLGFTWPWATAEGKVIGDVLAGALASEGLRFLACVEGAEMRMAGLAGNAAVAAVDEGERTQIGTVLGAVGGHGSSPERKIRFWIFGESRGGETYF